jgi:hypothetical protein
LGTPIPFFLQQTRQLFCCVDRIWANYRAAIAIRLMNMLNKGLPLQTADHSKDDIIKSGIGAAGLGRFQAGAAASIHFGQPPRR